MTKTEFIEAVTVIEVSLVMQGYSLDRIEQIEIDSLSEYKRDGDLPEDYLRSLAEAVERDAIALN